jgi:hypothetical protein
MPMLYRIEVNGIAMPFEIDLVTQGVLPVASLPDATFAFGVATWRTRLTTRNTSRELVLISLQHVAKSASPEGRVQIVWR